MSTFKEYDADYTLEEAIVEANRCLHCPKPLCQTGCPIEQQIPQFITAISQGNIGLANEIALERSNLPFVCGKVCPREEQCEGHCIMHRMNKPPINIGKLERFASNFVNDRKLVKTKKIKVMEGKVAIVGSGPAGLSAAKDMVQKGFDVTVFEKDDEPGGVLLYGIPNFRLNKGPVRDEIERLVTMGVHFVSSVYVGVNKSIEELKEEGFELIFLATGTTVLPGMATPGEDKKGVHQAMDLLPLVQKNLDGKVPDADLPIKAGDKVIIIGGGNVAIDASRTSVRLGADTTVVYRRRQEDMPCLPSEFEEAKGDGVKFRFLEGPNEVLGGDSVEALKIEKRAVGEDGSICGIGEYETIPCNKLILAIGQKPNKELEMSAFGLEINEAGFVPVQEEPYYGMTSNEGVFAAGDVVHRPKTVVMAMREGKRTAAGMIKYYEEKVKATKC